MAATERAGRRPLRRAVVVAAVLGLAVTARADDRASAGLWVHADDDRLVVIHPAASAGVELNDDTRLGAHYEADVISAATVDVRTSASPRGYEETRHGASASLERDLSRTLHLGGSYGVSWEPDYVSHAGSLRLSIEDDGKNRELSLALGAARDTVGRRGDAAPVGHLSSVGGTVSFATLISQDAVADASVALERQQGYLESPYRFVAIASPDGQAAVSVTESVPDRRWRGAVRYRLRLALTPTWLARAWWRVHWDDWGVAGHTVNVRLAKDLGERWLVAGYGRVYAQRAASFYEGRYATLPRVPRYRTRDRELAEALHVGGGLRVRWTVGHWLDAAWHVNVRAAVTWRRYVDTPILPHRLAGTTGIGLAMER